MARKTAHISALVEYDDEDLAYVNPQIVNANENGSGWPSAILDVTGCTIIGTPRVEYHDRPISGISFDELSYATGQMVHLGGAFAGSIGDALTVADSLNKQKLVDTFWNLICAYRP